MLTSVTYNFIVLIISSSKDYLYLNRVDLSFIVSCFSKKLFLSCSNHLLRMKSHWFFDMKSAYIWSLLLSWYDMLLYRFSYFETVQNILSYSNTCSILSNCLLFLVESIQVGHSVLFPHITHAKNDYHTLVKIPRLNNKILSLFIRVVSTNVPTVCTIMDHIIQFIEQSSTFYSQVDCSPL